MLKALIWGESLVGSGHARIQSELTRQLQEKGWEVSVITSSKQHTDHYDFGNAKMIYQAPLKLKTPESNPYEMENLITPNGKTLFSDTNYQRQRTENLLKIYHDYQPNAVITEMWPYARANFDFELLPLADAIKEDENHGQMLPPRLYSITRDIICTFPLGSTGLGDYRHAIAHKYFTPGSIFVRGDKDFVPLETSIGTIPDHVSPTICYVGYFGHQHHLKDLSIPDEKREVLVTSGGGITLDSVIMFKQAIAAKKLSSLKDRLWRILIPHCCPENIFQEISYLAQTQYPDGRTLVEHNRKDFPELLANAAFVICHGGNTIIEAVSANIALLAIPRELSDNNREQQIRARAFYNKGLIELATIAEISNPLNLAKKIDSRLKLPQSYYSIQKEGAALVTEKITQDWMLINAD